MGVVTRYFQPRRPAARASPGSASAANQGMHQPHMAAREKGDAKKCGAHGSPRPIDTRARLPPSCLGDLRPGHWSARCPRRRPSGPDVVHIIRRLRIYFRRRLCPRTGFVDFRVDFFRAGFAAFFLAGILAVETAAFFLVGFLAGILAATTVAFFALLACGFLAPGRGRETGLACFASAKRMDLIRSATELR